MDLPVEAYSVNYQANRKSAIGNRQCLAFVLHRLASLLEHFAVPDKAGARIGGQLKVLRQLEAVRRAGLLTEGAEHTTRRIENELVENFLAARLARHDDFDVHGYDIYAIFRTGQRAKITGDTQRVVRFRVHVQPRGAVKSRRHVRTHRRILLSVNALSRDRVFGRQRTQVEFQGQAESFQKVGHEEAFQLLRKRRFGNGN